MLPPGGNGRIDAVVLRRWLSRGKVAFADPDAEMLFTVLALLGVSGPDDGLAALRFWGQTGDRVGAWMVAADPVHLETRLHSLRLRSLRPGELSGRELGRLFDHLQTTLGTDAGISFTRLNYYGYLRCDKPIASAPVSASVLHGLPPDEFIAGGESAPAHNQLLGELQMALHDHEVNQERAATGQPEINSLWIWGGGFAPEVVPKALPFLIADDALFRGYWHSCAGEGTDWDDGFEDMKTDFVAVMPELNPVDSAAAMDDCLERVKRMLAHGKIASVTMLFRDGLSVQMNRWDTLMLWRGESPLLQKNENND